MKKCLLLITLCYIVLGFAQEKQFNLNWKSSKTFETASGKKEMPAFDDNHYNYDDAKGLTFFSQWESTSGLIDENSITLSKISYQTINRSELKNLNLKLIPNQPIYKFRNTSARGKKGHYFEISPIINANGVFKKIISFSIQYARQNSRSENSEKNTNFISNSVLNTGQWYRFYIDKSGIFQLTKNFLNSLGINTNAVDPRTIKIFGNGGRMLPFLNSENHPFDPIENAVKFIGEADGNFNNEDYILFYGEGPDTYNQESDTNVNLYTDKTYYYVNISPGNGKRMQPMPVISANANLQINTFQDYQFYEVDDVNIVKLGRRWFGDAFDIENQRIYEFEFPNLVTTTPVRFSINAGATSTIETDMSITVNSNNVGNLGFSPITGVSTLGSSSAFNNTLTIASDKITVTLDYDNKGNPSSNAFLDYINIEATRGLIYEDKQLTFRNSLVNTTPGIAEYTISNTSNVSELWDISDRFNITSLQNSNNQNNISFKAQSGSPKTYLAFSNSDVFEPLRDGQTTVNNQNLKGTIFNNTQGVFKDIDYIILTPTLLVSQAERLAQINRDQYNLSVKVVTLEDIYTEFSTGSQDIAAIRNFVKYVYDNASTDANKLKYLCLFGDGSYDYKDRINDNTNLVPSWYSLNSFSLSNSFLSDDFYGMLDNNEGSMNTSIDRLDIAIGRILVEDIQRAKAMVDKIEAYYAKEAFGSWRNNLILISDDVDISGEERLQETTDGLATSIEIEKPFFNTIKIHSDAFQQEASSAGDRYPQVNKAIRDAIEVGALVVNYFGHGGEDGLAVERIFDKFDSQEINNICKFNLFITMTCEYTKFDDPGRVTSGEYTFWNTKGGAIALITTTRQIFLSVGVAFNQVLDDYLFAFGTNDYVSMAEALRLAKTDNGIAGSSQKRLTFFIGDPAMKLAVPKPNITLTKVNDKNITQPTDTLKALSYTKLEGEVTDLNGNLLSNYNGVLTATVFDKEIERQTLANDRISDSNGLIKLDFTTLGEIIFKGQAKVENGLFKIDFIVPKDIGIPEGSGKISFYAQDDNTLADQSGVNFDVIIGGINENAPEDTTGPVINLFMNDENFVSGGITSESPTVLVKLQDEHGINTASGIGHDISAIIDGDETNPILLNDYYQANIDDYTNGTVTYAFRDLEPGLHTLTLKAWDVYNNSSTAEIQFTVFDSNEDLVINNVLNYPNPFVSYTEFWFNHNSTDTLDISVQIFSVSGKLVRTLNGQTSGGSKSTSSLSKDIIWDGRDDFGDKIGKGVYVYKLKVKSQRLNKQVEKIEKLVIL